MQYSYFKKKKAYDYGLESEDLAAKELVKLGMNILAKRFHTPFGELDLIMQDKEYTVFVEVKARRDMEQKEIVSRSKIIKVCKAADFYMMKLELPQDMAVRFDYIAIEGSHIVSHIKNAWDYYPHS
jgi:putative endonuclease